jgi:hypothetical protein
MAKVFFNLQGGYEGLRVRRLKRSARIVLDQVINDLPHYWFVTIRNFNARIDRPRLVAVGERPWGNGTWRFLTLECAESTFERLRTLPEYAAEERRAENCRIRQRERLLEYQHSGKIGLRRRIEEKQGIKHAGKVRSNVDRE